MKCIDVSGECHEIEVNVLKEALTKMIGEIDAQLLSKTRTERIGTRSTRPRRPRS